MKMTKIALVFCALAPLAIGCGGVGADDTTTVAAADLSMPVFKVGQRHVQRVDADKVGTDSCMQNLDTANPPFATLQVTNDGQGHLSLGSTNVSYLSNPAFYSQGTGMFSDSYHVTTHLDDPNANATCCMFHLVRDDMVTVSADNTLNVQYTQSQTGHMGTCTVVATDCTSAYNFTLKM